MTASLSERKSDRADVWNLQQQAKPKRSKRLGSPSADSKRHKRHKRAKIPIKETTVPTRIDIVMEYAQLRVLRLLRHQSSNLGVFRAVLPLTGVCDLLFQSMFAEFQLLDSADLTKDYGGIKWPSSVPRHNFSLEEALKGSGRHVQLRRATYGSQLTVRSKYYCIVAHTCNSVQHSLKGNKHKPISTGGSLSLFPGFRCGITSGNALKLWVVQLEMQERGMEWQWTRCEEVQIILGNEGALDRMRDERGMK